MSWFEGRFWRGSRGRSSLDSIRRVSVTWSVRCCFVPSSTQLHIPPGASQRRSVTSAWCRCWLAQIVFIFFLFIVCVLLLIFSPWLCCSFRIWPWVLYFERSCGSLPSKKKNGPGAYSRNALLGRCRNVPWCSRWTREHRLEQLQSASATVARPSRIWGGVRPNSHGQGFFLKGEFFFYMFSPFVHNVFSV